MIPGVKFSNEQGEFLYGLPTDNWRRIGRELSRIKDVLRIAGYPDDVHVEFADGMTLSDFAAMNEHSIHTWPGVNIDFELSTVEHSRSGL